MRLPESYLSFSEIIVKYWRIYGGWRELLLSPILHAAIFLSVLSFPFWETEWSSSALNIISNLLGFTLGGYAILLALGDQKFIWMLAGDDDSGDSPYIGVNAAFVHFLILQIITLLIILVSKAWLPKEICPWTIPWIFSAVGYTFFLYALLTTLAATFAIFRLSTWYNRFVEEEKKKNSCDTK
uniref:Uncharacterized protein n=1 Tax=Candidatus Kentrum sp. TC TaxID=2126339 RepID=A0A450ZZZ2_9GAMM|nr:MAG: hypothetical protein BECKTC1821F_GA0114240_10321 [Candidatus Kentron sp. TC]